MNKVCSVEGCKSITRISLNRNLNIYLCENHRSHITRYGFIKERTIQTPNEIIYYSDYAEIILYRNEIECSRTKIDLDDVEQLKNFKWYEHRGKWGSYAVSRDRNNNGKYIRLNRLLLNPKRNNVVDHINRDSLDNRRKNLREVSNRLNCCNTKISKNNTSGCVGVVFNKRANKWMSQIKVNYKSIHLGYFKNFQDAVNVRKQAELKYFGEIIKR